MEGLYEILLKMISHTNHHLQNVCNKLNIEVLMVTNLVSIHRRAISKENKCILILAESLDRVIGMEYTTVTDRKKVVCEIYGGNTSVVPLIANGNRL